jgi:NTP pyrophosphatase (non-canonical NTP hydrolase)
MTFEEIKQRALEIRQKYAELEVKKYGRSWSGEELTLGLVGDVGDLCKLVESKEGVREVQDVDIKLAHELSDCLWAIIVIADRYGVNLEKEFIDSMKALDVRIAREIPK